MTKILSEILTGLCKVDQDVVIQGINLDSRKVVPGDLFIALQGAKLDGTKFIDQAIAQGAAAVIADTEIKSAVPVFAVSNLAEKVSILAANFYDHPAEQLKVVGITGTNGKTSCAYFIAQALEKLALKTGIIGTLGIGTLDNMQAGELTTPDAVTLQKSLKNFLTQQIGYVAMEVSSHSLVQARVNDIPFAVGVFTNLSRDHLDYHGTMLDYGLAKQKLFEIDRSQFAVLNLDDAFSATIMRNLNRPFITYSLTLSQADVYADNIRYDEGLSAWVHTPWGKSEIHANLIGEFNLSNVLATLASLCLLNIPFEQAVRAIASLSSVPGRMEKLGGGSLPTIVIDFSHTPDSLEKALKTLKKHCNGKLICVFGCGGDRDKGKRPIMGQIAETYADFTIVTNDNPRSEDPALIAQEILAGMQNPGLAKVELNREAAIKQSLAQASKDDCILIAGKGAERFQYIGQEKLVFNDKDKVESLIGEL